MRLSLPPTAAARITICHQLKALQDSQLELLTQLTGAYCQIGLLSPVEEKLEFAPVCLVLQVLQLKMNHETWVFLALDMAHTG